MKIDENDERTLIVPTIKILKRYFFSEIVKQVM